MSKPNPETIALRAVKRHFAGIAKIATEYNGEYLALFGEYPGPVNKQICMVCDAKGISVSGGGGLTPAETLILFKAVEEIVTARYEATSGTNVPEVAESDQEDRHDPAA